ncbi:MAG TPA: hypothetical protein VFA62_10605 [Acidimicrobiia bacterium]|nr:hypothetical protein [Acidimicrobiia bacterium]
MKRRTRLIIKVTATAIIIASVVLARLLSDDDDVANFGIGQAALFLAFGVSSIVLFAMVVTDFDRWTETVSPVPKRAVRRLIGRLTRRIRRAGAWALALFGFAMTWFWSGVGGALGWLLARAAHRLSWFWLWVARVEGALLAKIGVALTLLWLWVVRAASWSGNGITAVWASAVRAGERALVVYRGVMQRFWTAVGHGFAWAVVRSGEGLTVAWAVAVRGGVRALVRYRSAMQWLWSTMGHAARWAANRTAIALRVVWTVVARVLAWTLRLCRAGFRRGWLAVAGRGDEPTPKPIRRWYSATVDSAFGVPPEGTSVDVFGGRVGPRGREGREGEKVGAPTARRSRGNDDDAAL